MKEKDFFENNFSIGCSVMIECQTSKHGFVQEIVNPQEHNWFDNPKVKELENRFISEISKFRLNGTSGILLKLEDVKTTKDGYELIKVISRYFDDGRVNVRMEKATMKDVPKTSSSSTSKFDEYVDYFDTALEAEIYREECYNA